jgi:signal transduction histidine kinase
MGVGMDLSALRKNGTEFPVEVSLSTYKNNEGTFSIAFISDISVRKTSENALRQLNDELERKVEERTQSLRIALDKEKELGELKSRFVSMASHEFRTPLSTILSSAYLIGRYADSGEVPKRDKHIQRIVSSVNMLTDILNDFLSLGKIEEGRIQVRPAPIFITGWIKEVLSELQTTLKAGQRIHYAHTGEEGQVLLDPSLLKHIVQNLVSNAGKFSPANAAITVQTNLHDGGFELGVKDQGIGISAEDQKHLSERFFRGANAVNIQGTGLGLHIVSRYSELMKGTLSWESALDEGTTFRVTFKTEAV